METILTTDSFEAEVLQNDLPVLVDFYADWCGPCQMMAPLVEELSEEFAGKLKVCKCNIDNNMPLAQKYRVVSIPTFKIFKSGECVSTQIGGMGADEFADWVESNL